MIALFRCLSLVLLFTYSCASFENLCGKLCEIDNQSLEVSDDFLKKFDKFKIKPRSHQIIPVHYLYTNSNQKGLLINHFVGTGKTYLSMFFTELYEKESVIIIGPSYLEANWIDSLKNFPVRDLSRYEFIAYRDAPQKLLGRDLSKTLLILDEAHNLTRYLTSYRTKIQSSYTDLYLSLFEAYKILALTATPIQNNEADIAYLLNLVMGKKVIPVNKEQFRLQHTEIIKNRAFWRGHISESLMVQNAASVVGVAKMLGYLTLVPPAIGIAGVLFPFINLVFYPLSELRLRKFDPDRLRYYSGSSVSFSGYTSLKGNTDYPENILHIKEVEYSPAQHRLFFKFASKDLSPEELNLFFPQFEYSNEKFNVVGSTLLDYYRYDLNSGLEIGNFYLKDDKGTVHPPPKFLAIKEYLNEPIQKTVIYSLFAKNGIELFAKFLDDNGFKGRYEMLSARQTTDEQRKIIQRYNEDKNKILLLYPEVTEGVDLKGTRQLHLLESIGNNSHFEQVKGRTIRYKSHAHLPPGERQVDVYVWKAMLEDTKHFLRGGNVMGLIGSRYRREDHYKRYSELNYYSQFGSGKYQVDKNFSYKYWSPDEEAAQRLEVLKESINAFYEMLSQSSIERHYREEEKPDMNTDSNDIKSKYRKHSLVIGDYKRL